VRVEIVTNVFRCNKKNYIVLSCLEFELSPNMWRNFKVICYAFTNKQMCFQDGSQVKGTEWGSETIACGFETGTREGHRNCDIVKLLHIPESTIRSIWKKHNSTGNVENIPRVVRPRKVTRRSEVRLLRTVKKNRGKVLREITYDFNEGGVVCVHPKTIQHYLHKNKTRCCTLRRAKNTPTSSFVSNLYISQHSLPENGSQTNLKHRALHKSL
jgi:transposase